jgi:superfamily II DNA helicase RecQ
MKNTKELLTISIDSENKLEYKTIFCTSEKIADDFIDKLKKEGIHVVAYYQHFDKHSMDSFKKISNGVYITK